MSAPESGLPGPIPAEVTQQLPLAGSEIEQRPLDLTILDEADDQFLDVGVGGATGEGGGPLPMFPESR